MCKMSLGHLPLESKVCDAKFMSKEPSHQLEVSTPEGRNYSATIMQPEIKL